MYTARHGIPDLTVANVLSKHAFGKEKNYICNIIYILIDVHRYILFHLFWRNDNLEHPTASPRTYQADPDAKKSEAYQKPPTIGPGADSHRDLHWKLGEIWHPCYLFKIVQMCGVSVKGSNEYDAFRMACYGWMAMTLSEMLIYLSLDFMSIQVGAGTSDCQRI